MAFSPGKATSKTLFWTYLSFPSTQLLYVVAVIIMARHVDPAEFGLMAFPLWLGAALAAVCLVARRIVLPGAFGAGHRGPLKRSCA